MRLNRQKVHLDTEMSVTVTLEELLAIRAVLGKKTNDVVHDLIKHTPGLASKYKEGVNEKIGGSLYNDLDNILKEFEVVS